MRLTEKQKAAIRFVANNPGSTFDEIAQAAGASVWGTNDAEFVRRLIHAGMLQITITGAADEMLDNWEL